MRSGSISSTGILLGLLLVWGLATPALAEEATSPAATPAPVQPVEEAPGTDVTVRSQEALTALDRLKSEIENIGGTEKRAATVEQLRDKVDRLLPEGQNLDNLSDNPALIDGVLVRSRALSNQAGTLIDSLTGTAEELEAQLAEIKQIVTRWERVKEEAVDLPEALSERVDSILESAGALERVANEKLNKVVQLQNVSMAARNLITPIADRINSYGRSQQTRLFEQSASPVWNLTSEHISESTERSSRNLLANLRRDFNSWTDTSEASIGAHLLLLPLILFLLYRLRLVAPETPSAALAKPVPTGVLVWMLIGIAVYAGAPVAVRMAYVIVAILVATVVLLNFLPRSMRAGVIVFVVIAIAERLIDGLAVTDHLPRLSYLVMSAVLLAVVILGRRKTTLEAFVTWGAPQPLVVGTIGIAAVLLSISLLANLLGYVHLAKLLFSGVVDSFAVFLILFAGLTSISEIIEAALSLPGLDPFRSISANRYRLKRALRRPLVWLALLLWLWVTTQSFGIDAWLVESIFGIVQAEISFGSVTLSLRGILGFVFAIWLAVWSSRIVLTVLNQDVLPRMDLPRGVPNTIAMTAHYSIIMIGLLLGVGFMGIDLSSLAFVVGALGVGIGFGLQNLVNNFVSGLILIFEAPIQVGDTVEVGTLMGTVMQIGIRTSRVRTFSGSEVIVPNGDLVSNQVINWTLSDRRRRLELNVGVAYGTDPNQVSDVLQSVMDSDEGTLKDPAPIIVFSEFGDSALNFRVLVWVADFDVGFSTTHRLNTAIYAALDDAGISIPFPQRDLHVKTLPPGAGFPSTGGAE